jgi:2-octaprenyl-6-methoxyphenol hydroxylase
MTAEAYDIAVVGGGLIGSTLAHALGQAGFRVILLERNARDGQLADTFDGRTTALAASTVTIMRSLGLWAGLAAVAGPIADIRVSDRGSGLYLHFDHSAVGTEPMGYIVENRHLRRMLADALAAASTITAEAPVSVASIERSTGCATLTLADGRTVSAQLVIGTDGKNSLVRQSAGIRTIGWAYDQTALVTVVRHEEPHRGIAHERFLKGGPLALLPMLDPNLSSLVWTEETKTANRLEALSDADFAAEVARAFGPWLGSMTLATPRSRWDLSLHHATRYVAPRLALAGDAAHGIHPIAGQGANLGWRDIAVLAEILVDARRLGLDIGGIDVLNRYQAWRRPDNITLAAATDGLNRLFRGAAGPIGLARDLGLGAVNRIPPLKHFFMRHAMGMTGTLPRLARGEAL